MAGVLIAMYFTPSLIQELRVSLIALVVVVVAYLALRARRRTLGTAGASAD